VKKWIATYAAVAVGMTVVWFLLVFAPLYKKLGQLEMQITESQQQLADFEQIMSQLPRYIEAREKLRAQRAALSSRLYSKDDILKLFDHLKRQAAKKNLTVTEISPPVEELLHLNSMIPDSTQPLFLNIALTFEGGYIEFGQFVGLVERADYFRGINECTIIGSKDPKDSEGHLRLKLGFKAILGGLKEGA
jgi:Tfp pilus assembly protein PilO